MLFRGPFRHHFYRLPHQTLIDTQGLPVLHIHQFLQPGVLHVIRNLILHPGGRSAAAFGINKGKSGIKAHLFHQTAGLGKILIRFAGEPYNDICGNSSLGNVFTYRLHQCKEPFPCVTPVHGF